MRAISSSASTSCTSAPPTVRASSVLRASRISATMLLGLARRGRARWSGPACVLMTCASGSSPSGASTMMDFAALRIDDREVAEVARIAAAADDLHAVQFRRLGGDLVLHLDLVAVGEDDDARSLAAELASASSAMMSTIDGDQLRMMVWPVSSTRERPLRSSAILASSPELRDADQGRDHEDAGQRHHQHHDAVAPALVPAHRAAIERAHQRFPDRLDEAARLAALGRDAGDHEERGSPPTMITSDSAASHPISAIVPADMLLSNM